MGESLRDVDEDVEEEEGWYPRIDTLEVLPPLDAELMFEEARRGARGAYCFSKDFVRLLIIIIPHAVLQT